MTTIDRRPPCLIVVDAVAMETQDETVAILQQRTKSTKSINSNQITLTRCGVGTECMISTVA